MYSSAEAQGFTTRTCSLSNKTILHVRNSPSLYLNEGENFGKLLEY
jgi:hypothetical protein